MDGIHDLGGMDGFGPVQHRPDEPTFHADWERTAFATVLATMAHGVYNMDEFRHAIERMDPAWYLESSYYDHWLAAVEKLLVERDVLDPDELTARLDAVAAGEVDPPEREDPELAALLGAIPDAGASRAREPGDPAFEPGDAVRVRNRHPEGHTRCPGYVRRAPGTVAAVHGRHALPDANAHGEGERPEPLYSVRFDGADLWGEDAEPATTVSVDLWESYLEPR